MWWWGRLVSECGRGAVMHSRVCGGKRRKTRRGSLERCSEGLQQSSSGLNGAPKGPERLNRTWSATGRIGRIHHVGPSGSSMPNSFGPCPAYSTTFPSRPSRIPPPPRRGAAPCCPAAPATAASCTATYAARSTTPPSCWGTAPKCAASRFAGGKGWGVGGIVVQLTLEISMGSQGYSAWIGGVHGSMDCMLLASLLHRWACPWPLPPTLLSPPSRPPPPLSPLPTSSPCRRSGPPTTGSWRPAATTTSCSYGRWGTPRPRSSSRTTRRQSR